MADRRRANRIWRRAAAAIALVVAAPLVAACGGDDGAAQPAAGPSATGDAFPVSIEHKYGTTTIEEEPVRVVSVGFTDQDDLLALGVVPVGIREWYGEQPFAVWPWAQPALGDAEPEVLSADEINFEAVAALRPDLIVGVSSGMTQEEYGTLSAIAPTITQTDAYVDYGVPWQDQTLMIGEAVGRLAEARDLVDGVEAQFTAATGAHPEFEGASGVVAFAMAADEIGGYSDQDVRSRILTDLGFEIPQEITDLAGESFYASFSAENADRLDADAVVWIAATDDVIAQIEASPLRQGYRPAQEGREVFADAELSGATGFSSPLSLPFVLDELVPRLAAAVDGDPATPTDRPPSLTAGVSSRR